MTDTEAPLITECPVCGEGGDFHCASTACTWLRCRSCTGATKGLYGYVIPIDWDVHTGRMGILPKPSTARRTA